MKVMYFTIEGFDIPNANNHLAQTMMETFLDKNIEVFLLQSNRGGAETIPDSLLLNPNFSYKNIKRRKIKKNNFVGRYFEGIRYAFDAKKEWKKIIDSIDAIIVQSTYLSWLSIKMLSKYKKPIIFSIFDLFPNVVFDVGASHNKLLYKILLKLQNIAYQKSNRIVVITDDVKEKLINSGEDKKKIVKIVNWYDENKIHEISLDDNEFIQKNNIDVQKFIVQYAGNFGYTFNYDYVIETAKLLEDYSDIEFHMIGAGTFECQFKNKAEKLKNIVFFPWQSLDVISDVYSSCSLGFIPLSKGVIGNSFPSKMPLIMACHRTFVTCANMESFYSKEVNDNKIGICVSDTNPKDAADAILYLYKNRNKKKEYEENAFLYTKNEYGSSYNAIKFVELLEELVNE